MYSAGLIFEGGGMRGAYTTGVIDAFLDNDLEFSSCYGVSVGACNAASFIAKQRRRAYRVTTDYIGDKRYCSILSLLRSGNLFGPEMLYHIIPEQLDPYDYDAFARYPGKLSVVATNCETGEAEYFHLKNMREEVEMLQASSSLPLLAKIVRIDGKEYLDGGVVDSIPIQRSIADGNSKNVVVLTQDITYRKEPMKIVPLLKIFYRNYPNLVHQLATRHARYNQTLDFLAQEESAGRAFVIRPKKPVNIGRVETNKTKLAALYDDGYRETMGRMEDLIAFLEK
ncbi:MAG: patatin family protein [Methanocorpusculum sp.]|uniref:patatin-like phospholipase family protein n=1 Tax=Methanocorpusculum sp. TaxID=2058474 RepID=UPI00272390D7|nr:patatin family protein [Methanocorpusculum sp.]MDO9523380.1 patatin family protein [Methanocorpusculum sp.]